MTNLKMIRGWAAWSFFLLAVSKSPAAGDGRVSVALDQRGGVYKVRGEFTAPVSPQTAWNVLTDYDHLSRFLSSVHSHIRSEKGDDLLVQQAGCGGFLFFTACVDVLLRVHEDPLHFIAFQDVSGKDFKSYAGNWTLQPTPGGVRVVYLLTAERNSHTPGFLSGDSLRDATRDQLGQVRREMERRAGDPKGTPT